MGLRILKTEVFKLNYYNISESRL